MLKRFLLTATMVISIGFNNVNAEELGVLEDSVEWNGHYYKIFPMRVNWETANKFCNSIGGHLAIPETREENEMLKQLFLKYRNDINECRIGGYRDESGIWRWINGKIIANYFDWGNNQPRDGNTLMFNRELDGRWETIDSDGWRSEQIFMCEWESANDAHDSTL